MRFTDLFNKASAFLLLAGIFGGVFGDLLLFMSSPTQANFNKFTKDLLSIIVNAQKVVYEAVHEFVVNESISPTYAYHLIFMIASGSLVTLAIIYILYKIFSMVNPSMPLANLLFALLTYYFITIAISIYVMGTPQIKPFFGWWYLVEHIKDIMDKMPQQGYSLW